MGRRGVLRSLAVLVAVTVGSTGAEAAPLRLGFSGVHALPTKVWAGLSDADRLLFVAERLERAAQLGAEVVRLGATEPRLIDYAKVHASQFRNWLFADKVVGLLSASPLEVCVTLPELFDTAEIGAFQAYIAAFAERYDGDADFGIEPVAIGAEFPDLNGSGEITPDEFQAKPGDARVQTWAVAHEVTMIEPGHEPRAAEQTGKLSVGAYAAQVKTTRTATTDAGGGQRVMLGGTAVENQSKTHFVERLAGLSAGGPWFDAANAHLYASVDDLTGVSASANVTKLRNWLEGVGHGPAERWVGEVALGTAAATGTACVDARCSPRTQAAGLVRHLLLAAADGVTTVLYAEPIEVVGPAASTGARTGTGLLTVSLESRANPFGLKDNPLPLVPRPAYAVWRRLGEALGEDDADVTPMSGLPQNVRGFRVGSRGYVIWYDWTLEAQPGEAWSGQRKPVDLEGLGSASVKVVSLWPETVATQLEADGSVEATWSESLVGVVGGRASIFVEQDPVWVEPSDEVVAPPVPDEGPDDVGGGDVAEGPEASGGSGGGCAGGGSTGSGALASLASLAWLALGRRRGRR